MDKTTLKNHYGRVVELEEMKERIEELESAIEGVGAQVITDEPKGGKTPELADKIVELGDLKNECDELNKQFDKEKKLIEQKIKQLEVPLERAIMRYRYIRMMQWEIVAEESGYSESHVKRIHGIALKNLFPKDDTK